MEWLDLNFRADDMFTFLKKIIDHSIYSESLKELAKKPYCFLFFCLNNGIVKQGRATDNDML